MDDAISRQAVLKLLAALPPEEATTKALLIQSVKQMDAPDNLVKDSQGLAKDLVNDCISRKAALDALEKSKEIYFDRQVIIGAMKGIVRSLPSAQPELIRCKNCKHNQLPSTSGNANCEIFYGMTDQDGFCHMAERRTDE